MSEQLLVGHSDERGSGELSPAQEIEVEMLREECETDPSTCPLNTLEIGTIYNARGSQAR